MRGLAGEQRCTAHTGTRSVMRPGRYGSEHHGIEARYPFLDPMVVQEFLWLAPELKNSEYKRPVFDFLEAAGYELIRGKKQGFDADVNVRDERSLVSRCALAPI